MMALLLCGCLQSGPLDGSFAPAETLEGDWIALRLSDNKASKISVAKLTSTNIYGISILDDHKFYTAVFLTSKQRKGYLMVLAFEGHHLYALLQPDTPTSWRMRLLTLRKDNLLTAAAALRALKYGLYIKQDGTNFKLDGKLDALNVSDLFDDPVFISAIDFAEKYSINASKFPPDNSTEMKAARSQELNRLSTEVDGQLKSVKRDIYEVEKDLERIRRQP
jgi:hypothetical protein